MTTPIIPMARRAVSGLLQQVPDLFENLLLLLAERQCLQRTAAKRDGVHSKCSQEHRRDNQAKQIASSGRLLRLTVFLQRHLFVSLGILQRFAVSLLRLPVFFIPPFRSGICRKSW